MNKSETIGALAAALAKAQGEMKGAVKDSANPFFKSSYADLSSVWDACRKPLSDNGLAVIQTLSNEGTAVCVETMLVHSSGEWVSDKVAVTPAKMDAQGYGAVSSYLRRYSLSSIIGGYSEDPDAEPDRMAHEEKKEIKPPQAAKPKDAKSTLPALSETCATQIAESKNIEELGNVWNNILASADKLTKEETKVLNTLKNKRKKEFEAKPKEDMVDITSVITAIESAAHIAVITEIWGQVGDLLTGEQKAKVMRARDKRLTELKEMEKAA